MAKKQVNFKEVASLLLGDELKGEKWPLVIDPSGNVATFLKYRHVNYLDAKSPHMMTRQSIRRLVLGAIRFGKPLVLDMSDVDMFDECAAKFELVRPGFMASILDKSIMQEDKYSKLIENEDGPEYEICAFTDNFVSEFKFIVITANTTPPQSLLDVTYPVEVIM